MRILFMAPQPFYQERGTPIAVDLAVRVLEGAGHRIDLLTYPEGESRPFTSTVHRRTARFPGVNDVPPGFSWKKLLYSGLMCLSALRLLVKGRYQVMHAVEESVFIALLMGKLFRLPYVYDMDSSLAMQLLDKKPVLRVVGPLLCWFENLAIRHAAGVVAVCPALVELAEKAGAENVLLLSDISLLDRDLPGDDITSLRLALPGQGPIFLYVGNLEHYQGIDLLLEGWAEAEQEGACARLVVIGGRDDHLAAYREKAKRLKIQESVAWLGPRPVADLRAYIEQADVLVSPRFQGNNTPMKLYTYLDSGKAILATRIESHTQVMTDRHGYLVEPTPAGMASGIRELARSEELRAALGRAGRDLAREKYVFAVFEKNLSGFYERLLGS